MKFKLVYIVHSIVLLLFIRSIYYSIKELNDYYYYIGNNFSWFSLNEISYSAMTLLLILPLIGVLLKNRIGWIFIAYYFYMMILNVFAKSYNNIETLKLSIIFFIIISILLIIMNLQKTSLNYYKILRKDLLGVNLISFVIGGCASFLLFILKNRHYFN